MKTVVLRRPGGPEVLETVDVPLPIPKADEVLIRTKAIGVSRPDVLIRKGIYAWMPPLPASPGSELTGIVEAAGADVDTVRPGQSVLLSARDLPVRGAATPRPLPFRQRQCIPSPTELISIKPSCCRAIWWPTRCSTTWEQDPEREASSSRALPEASAEPWWNWQKPKG